MKISRRPLFILDEYRVFAYVAERNPSAARKLVAELDAKYRLLAEFPDIGVRLARRPNARIFPYGNYVILYAPLVDASGIDLIRLYGPRANWSVVADNDFDASIED